MCVHVREHVHRLVHLWVEDGHKGDDVIETESTSDDSEAKRGERQGLRRKSN